MGTVFFKCVDQPAAGLERRRTVRRRHHDQHARLADLDPAQPVHYRRIPHAEVGDRFLRQRPHLR